MKRLLYSCFVILLSYNALAQHQPEKAGRFENGQFVLHIDLRWNKLQQQKFMQLYELDSNLVVQIFSGNIQFSSDSFGWKILEKNNQNMLIAEQSRPKDPSPFNRISLLNQALSADTTLEALPDATYGINRLTDQRVLQQKDGQLCFFLPEKLNATRVFLAGSFNQWSTINTPLTKTDSGWVCCLPLAPGKHTYKYIIDGRWQHDPSNKNRENDGQNGYNSVAYVYNYIFSLKGFEKTKKVLVTGSFNGWNENELRLNKKNGEWLISMFLKEGTHTYKFIVDGKWMTDPENNIVRQDDFGNENSVTSIGDTLLFILEDHLHAHEVVVSGNFNAWQTNELKMKRTANGWILPYVLAAGIYEYKFVVDGKWIVDPANPITNGEGDFRNSLLIVKPNFLFELRNHQDTKEVKLTGSFLSWSRTGIPMQPSKNGWKLPYYLHPGRHTYKFIVNGEWIVDPENPYIEENEFGTGNSVLWMK